MTLMMFSHGFISSQGHAQTVEPLLSRASSLASMVAGQFAPQIERAENGSKRVNRFGRLASSSNRIRQFLFARCRAFFLILHNGTLVPIQPPLFVHCENN